MIPEEEWTKNQREFVGSQFDTPKGGVLTVVGVDSRSKTGIAAFSVECSICSKDTELFPSYFRETKGHLLAGRVPCGCTKLATITEEQDIILTNRVLQEKHKNLKVTEVHGKDNNKLFILECEVCSEDEELFPYGEITSNRNNLKKGKIPCGCGSKYVWDEIQNEIRVKRLCDKLGYDFCGWFGDHLGNKTRLILHNPTTGNTLNTTSLGTFMAGHRDPWLTNKSQPDSFHRNKFLATGKYHENTKFKKLPKTKRGMWEVTCGGCGSVYTSGMANLKRGQVGCICAERGSFRKDLPATLYISKFKSNQGCVVLKFGITNKDISVRREAQERSSGMNGETIATYSNEKGTIISEIEKELKRIIKIPRVPKEVMPDGYTESVYYKPFVEKFIVNYLEMITSNLDK